MPKKSREKREDEKCSEEWLKAYQEISRLTRIPLRETVDKSYSLVTDKSHKLFREIGVYSNSENLCKTSVVFFRNQKVLAYTSALGRGLFGTFGCSRC